MSFQTCMALFFPYKKNKKNFGNITEVNVVQKQFCIDISSKYHITFYI